MKKFILGILLLSSFSVFGQIPTTYYPAFYNNYLENNATQNNLIAKYQICHFVNGKTLCEPTIYSTQMLLPNDRIYTQWNTPINVSATYKVIEIDVYSGNDFLFSFNDPAVHGNIYCVASYKANNPLFLSAFSSQKVAVCTN